MLAIAGLDPHRAVRQLRHDLEPFSRIHQLDVISRDLCALLAPVLLDADWCLQSDAIRCRVPGQFTSSATRLVSGTTTCTARRSCRWASSSPESCSRTPDTRQAPSGNGVRPTRPPAPPSHIQSGPYSPLRNDVDGVAAHRAVTITPRAAHLPAHERSQMLTARVCSPPHGCAPPLAAAALICYYHLCMLPRPRPRQRAEAIHADPARV